MASERIMQAVDALEQAMDRLERQVAALPPAVPDGELSASGASQARAALKSLDELIAELKAKTDG